MSQPPQEPWKPSTESKVVSSGLNVVLWVVGGLVAIPVTCCLGWLALAGLGWIFE